MPREYLFREFVNWVTRVEVCSTCGYAGSCELTPRDLFEALSETVFLAGAENNDRTSSIISEYCGGASLELERLLLEELEGSALANGYDMYSVSAANQRARWYSSKSSSFGTASKRRKQTVRQDSSLVIKFVRAL